MSDRELLALAAKAAGLTGEWWERYPGEWCLSMRGEGNLPPTNWDPLGDDGAALRLAVKLGLALYPAESAGDIATVSTPDPDGEWITEECTGDQCATLRRAIVRAAAAMAQAGEGADRG